MDLSSLQTLYDQLWGKVTALTCLSMAAAGGNKGESMCVGTIRGSICLIPRANTTSVRHLELNRHSSLIMISVVLSEIFQGLRHL